MVHHNVSWYKACKHFGFHHTRIENNFSEEFKRELFAIRSCQGMSSKFREKGEHHLIDYYSIAAQNKIL